MALNNDNNNECCKCTTPEYELILNEQGPQGRQGEKGDAGFTPIISVKDNTPSNYTLNILTQDGQITTPNLKANLPAGGATGQVLTKNSGEQDDCSWQNLPASTIETEGIARLATEADFKTTEDTEASDNTIVTPALFNSELTKQSAKFVTTDTEQAIEADKAIFSNLKLSYNSTSQKGSIITNASVEEVNIPIIEPYDTNGSFRIGAAKEGINTNAQNGFDINNNWGDGLQGVTYYEQGQKGKIVADFNLDKYVKAGDNITIDKTATGITINSTGGGVTEIPQANATTLGGVKANPKTVEDTQAVNIDPTTGLLYTKAGGGGSNNTVFNSASPIFINQNSNLYIDNNGFYILENSYINNGINNITVNDYNDIYALPTSGNITLNIQNVTGNKIDWDNNVLGFDITNPSNARIYAGDATQDFAKFIVLCNKSGNNVTPLYIAIGDDSRLGAYYVGNANSCLLNNIEFQDIQDNRGIYNANIKQIINNTPYDMQNFFVIILVDLNIIQLMCAGTDGKEHLLYNVSGLTDLANINYAYVLSGSTVARFNKDTVYSIVDGQKIYPTIIRNATDVNISLKYSNKFVLNNEVLDLANTITTQGNTFNGASQLVQLDSTGKLPAIDGSQLTNLPVNPAPTNMVTTDTVQNITGQKVFKNSFVTSDGTATTGNRVLINNNRIDLISNSGVAAKIDTEGIDLRGGINSSGLSLTSSSQLVSFGQNNTQMRIYASQLERYSNGSDNGAIILDAKNFSSVAPTGSLKYWTGTEEAYTGIASKNADTLYRTTDTNKVYLGTIQIGGQ